MKKASILQHLHRRKQQHGVVAIEFAALFLLFFTVLYGVVAYSLPMLLTLSYKHLSAEAARSAIRVDPTLDRETYKQLVSQQITENIDNSWLPEDWYNGNCPTPGSALPWEPLPASAGRPSFGYLAEETITPNHTRYLLQVCIQRKYNNSGSDGETAIIPVLKLGGLSIPSLPESDGDQIIRGRATIQL
ncbi:MAG: pilus assembly protein [Gammaproteobacteria bacterium]|nr:MAG: pilus assembly protein [Gammaproteobacteria bacterium]